MPEAVFYVLGPQSPTDQVCFRLVSKAWSTRRSLLIWCDDRSQAEQYDELLWGYEPERFLPHSLLDQDYPKRTPPILIGWNGLGDLPKAHVVLNRAQHPWPDTSSHERIMELVDGEESQRQKRRQFWKTYQQRGWICSSHQLP